MKEKGETLHLIPSYHDSFLEGLVFYEKVLLPLSSDSKLLNNPIDSNLFQDPGLPEETRNAITQ